MATTTNKNIVLLEVGQKEKEAAINAGFNILDLSPEYAGEFITASEPATTGFPPGSTYYNTTTSKLMFLNSSLVWTAVA